MGLDAIALWIVLGFVALMWLYVAARLVTAAIVRSWNERRETWQKRRSGDE
jgi:hypothetical protein